MAISKLNPSAGGIPFGNTAARPANPVIGDTYYNGQIEALEIYNGTNWKVAKSEGFPPDAPTISSVTDSSTSLAYSSTAGTLDVVLVPAATGGTATQYNAYTTTGGHSGFTTVGSTVTITGLTPGTAYTVYGNAQNGSGTSTNTANAGPTTPTTLPEVRTIGTATASTSANEVTVTWTNTNNGGKNLSAITITPFLNGTTAGTSRTAATTSSTSYTFTEGQLTGGSAYTFKVKATNANGTCADSTASNSATMPNFLVIEALVVAGGGGGGGNATDSNPGGAGGAGGLLYGTLSNLSKSTNYTVTVGAGGAGGATGVNGDNSVFNTSTALGGGAGRTPGATGLDGGSGGGGANNGGGGSATQTNSGGLTGFGFSGGSSPSNNNAGSGGGGAGGVGANASGSGATGVGGNGGVGKEYSITGTAVYYAGGGGGPCYEDGATKGLGGSGGGGNGARGSAETNTAGTANTGGGGGGGAGNSGSYKLGANGGSGVVILRWLTSAGTITIGAGLTADSTGTDGSYSYKRITAGSGNVSIS
jgi:hypothetical protein